MAGGTYAKVHSELRAVPRAHVSVAPEKMLQNDSGVLKYTDARIALTAAGDAVEMTAAMPAMEPSRLVLRGDLAELDRLASWIERWAEGRVPPDTTFALALCLEEAVANIIRHGGAEAAEIAIELECDGEALRARVEDCGREFDPTRFPAPIAATSLGNAKVGDLGIHLMRSFADGMHYERRGQRNLSTFRFAWSRTSVA